ncbi:hypothetical protein ACH419_30730 [Streptomyces bobili]|uniref:hypothetical protein n=1 Tax=Streptomyces bobili TaxID=67280 RepID=UPI00378DD6CF
MADERFEEFQRQAKLRELEEERRRRQVDADHRLQEQESQAQHEARLAEAPPAEVKHYAQLPRHSYTGIR